MLNKLVMVLIIKNMKPQLFFKKIFRIKSIIRILITIILLLVILVIFADKRIKSTSKNYLYSDLIEIPYKKVGLVLDAGSETEQEIEQRR